MHKITEMPWGKSIDKHSSFVEKEDHSVDLFLSNQEQLLCLYPKIIYKFIMMKNSTKILFTKAQGFTLVAILSLALQFNIGFAQNFPVVDTDQQLFYDTLSEIQQPAPGEVFYGQDANYAGNQPSYQDNGDGTVSDLVTGLMWQQSPDMDGDGDIDYDDKMSYFEAMDGAATFDLAGYTDWRIPSIKEMYSLIIFSGIDPSGYEGSTEDLIPFINTDYFDFAYGDESAGERIIDAQMASSNLYVGTTMMGAETMFGVNFADGRIKGYPTGPMPGQTVDKQFYVMYVRGNAEYGINNLEDNSDGTITDNATGLMWTQDDDGQGMNWPEALSYAEDFTYADFDDWRLPNAKELQSILDYERAPAVTNSAAIDPLFSCSTILDEGGEVNYPFYWTGTTHANWTQNEGGFGAYVCFGEALGFMEAMPPGSGNYTLMDVHGAGSQRSDPKTGNPEDWPYGHGPQGDVIRIYNFVRLVRDADSSTGMNELNLNENNSLNIYPSPATDNITVEMGASSSSVSTLQIINLLGEVIYSESENFSTSVTIDVSELYPGIYFVILQNEGNAFTKKFIKK